MKKILFNEKVLAHTTTSIAKYLKPKTLGIHHTKRVNCQMHDIWYHYMSGHCTSISIHTKKIIIHGPNKLACNIHETNMCQITINHINID